MSVQALSWVMGNSPTKGTDRLVLLSLANHAGELVDGAFEAYPGIDTIRAEANLDRRRTAQDAVTRLVNSGHVQRVVNGAPDRRIRPDRRPNLYRIVVGSGVSSERTPRDERGVAATCNGVSRERLTGPVPATPKPSEEPSENLTNQRRTRLPQDFEPNQTAQTLAIELGLTLADEVLHFADYHRANGSRFVDWQAALRSWLRKSADFKGRTPPRGPKPPNGHKPYRNPTNQERYLDARI